MDWEMFASSCPCVTSTGLRILPGRETAEPTWPRAVLWLMASNSPTTTDLGVGRLELGSGSGTNSPTLFLYPSLEMQRQPAVTPCSDMLEISIPQAQWDSYSYGAQVHPPRSGCWRGGKPQHPQLLRSSERVEGALGEAFVQTLVQNKCARNAGHTLTLIPGKVTAEEA